MWRASRLRRGEEKASIEIEILKAQIADGRLNIRRKTKVIGDGVL